MSAPGAGAVRSDQPAGAAAHPALRLVRPPDPDPPNAGGEVGGTTSTAPVEHVQGTLALLFTLPGGLPAAPPTAPPARGARAVELAAKGPGPVPLPDPRHWCARLVQAAVEVREGDRPTGQLLRWMTRDVHDQLCRDTTERRAGSSGHTRRDLRAVIRSLHITAPTQGTVEACAVVDAGGRSRAVALRLEAREDRWMCTAWNLL